MRAATGGNDAKINQFRRELYFNCSMIPAVATGCNGLLNITEKPKTPKACDQSKYPGILTCLNSMEEIIGLNEELKQASMRLKLQQQ